MAPCVSAPHESSGTSCSSCRDSSDRRRINPTCGPLPCVTTTFQPAATMPAMWCIDSAAAAYWSGTVRCWASRMRELPPTATTASCVTGCLERLADPSRHGQRHDRLLCVQAVLRFVVYDGVRAINDAVGHFQ